MRRACAVCGRPTSGRTCPEHQYPRPYRTAEYQASRAVVLADAVTCWLCGEPEREDDPFVADHLVPVVHGGSSGRGNLAAAHRSCNVRRGALV